MSILDGLKKINIPALAAICVVLGIMLAFGGLKLQAFTAKKEPLSILQSNIVETESKTTPKTSEKVQIIGSKTGTKYHLSNCPGAKTISDKNKVVFANIAAAQKAGYSPAQNCPGLKTK